MKQTLANEHSDSRQSNREQGRKQKGRTWVRQRDRMTKDGKRDEDGAGDGNAQPVARHSNLCMSKQDSQIYKEGVHEKNKEQGRPNATLKPFQQLIVQGHWQTIYTQACSGYTTGFTTEMTLNKSFTKYKCIQCQRRFRETLKNQRLCTI